MLRWTGSSVPSGQAPQLAGWGRIFVLKQLALISCAQQFPLSCCQLADVHWVLCIWFLTKQEELQWRGKLFLLFLSSLTPSVASNVTVAFLALGCLADNLSTGFHGNKWVGGKNNRFMPHCVFSSKSLCQGQCCYHTARTNGPGNECKASHQQPKVPRIPLIWGIRWDLDLWCPFTCQVLYSIPLCKFPQLHP